MKHNLATLSFARTDERGQILSMWEPAPGLSYGSACAEGCRRADEVVRAMERFENPTLLGHVVTAIVGSRNDLGGMEVGFFARIAALAIEGVLHSEAVVPEGGRPMLRLVEPG